MGESIARLVDRLPAGAHLIIVNKSKSAHLDTEVKVISGEQTTHWVFRPEGIEEIKTDETGSY